MEQINPERVKSALEAFSPESQMLAIKDRFANPRPSGYRDMALYIRMSNGHIVELQLHLAIMLAAKVKETPFYVESRNIQNRAAHAGRELTPAEREERADLMQQSRKIYEDAWENRPR